MPKVPEDVAIVIDAIKEMATGKVMMPPNGTHIGFDKNWNLGVMAAGEVYMPLPFSSIKHIIDRYGVCWGSDILGEAQE